MILRNNPSELAQKDSNEYELEKVLGHHNSLKFLSRVTFTCKWVGYDEVTEEPWENVRANAIVHEYLKEKGFKHKIPLEFI